MTKPSGHRRPGWDPNLAWSREQLRLLLGGLTVAALVILAGLGLALRAALLPADVRTGSLPTPTTAGGTVAGDPGGSGRDQAAAVPLPTVPSAGAGVVPLRLGWPTVLRGPGGVASGFDHTPEGAVAQLAALDEFVLTAMRPQLARDTYRAWALPGSPDAEAWLMTRNVDSFTTALERAGYGQAHVVVQVRPVAGQITATDGPDQVVACVLLDVRVTVKTEARLGYGHCERLQWADGRWQIGPGKPPTPPAPVSPGSPDATAAGWRTFTTE